MKRDTMMPDLGLRRWLVKTARNNYWRVADQCELEDLIEDGYCWYFYLRKRYPQATDRPHIMQLFKRTYINHLHDMSKGARNSYFGTRLAQCEIPVAWLSPGGSKQAGDDAFGSCSFSALLTCIVEAPEPVNELLKQLIAHPELLYPALRQHIGSAPETLNQRLCKIIGVDPHEYDLSAMLRNYLKGKPT